MKFLLVWFIIFFALMSNESLAFKPMSIMSDAPTPPDGGKWELEVPPSLERYEMLKSQGLLSSF